MKFIANSTLALLSFLMLFSTTNAKISVISSNETSLTVLYTPELKSMHVMTIDGNSFSQPIFTDASNILTEIGYPQMFANKQAIAVPSPVGFKIKNIEVGAIKQYQSIMAPVYYMGAENSTHIDRQAYLNRPVENWASIEYSGIGRDKYIASLNIIAAKYNPAYKTIDVPEYVKVTITFDNANHKTHKKLSNSKLNRNLLNSNIAKNWTLSDEQLYLNNDIEKYAKANKLQSEELLSSGDWFKISVNETGVYELTADYLKSFGISIPNDKIGTIKIFGNGGRELPQNVNFAAINNLNQQKITVKKNADGSLKSIIFFGAGVTGFEYVEKPNFYFGKKVLHYRNHYSNTNHYLLTWGGSERIRSNPTPKLEGTIENKKDTYTYRAFYEEELVNAFHSGSGKQFFGRTYFSEPFEKNLVNVADEGNITYKFSLGQAGAEKYGGSFSVYDNGSLISNNLYISQNGSEAVVLRDLFEFTLPLSELKNKSKSVLRFNYTNTGQPTANGIFDFYELHYTSRNVANNGEIYLFTDPDLSGLTEYKFTGFNGEVYAFDISDIGNPVQLQSYENNKFDLVTDLKQNEPKRFYISSTLKKPLNIEKFQMKNLRGTKFNDDVIVITNSKLLESAKKYKEYRESTSNLKIGIFQVSDIYNEYNAGTMDIAAIRDFVSQAMENWDVKPSYLVLWGDGHFDYRGLLTNKTNYVPPFESDDETAAFTEVNSVATDDFYARVVGDDRVIDIAIGRITVDSEEEGFKVVDKIKHYENSSNITNWRTKMTLVADDGFGGDDEDGDGNMFVNDAEEFSHDVLPDFIEQKKIYTVEFPSLVTGAGVKKPTVNAELLKTINEEGTLLLCWYGHGNPQVWSHEAILDRDVSIRQMTNYDRLFFLTAATCDFAKMDNYDSQSGAELMLLNEYGGGIGVFGASRIVYAGGNHAINKEFYRQLFKRNEDGTYPTLGEVYFNVKQTFYGGNDEKYYLLGDPTLKLLIPDYDVSFDTINGVAVNDTADITLKGLQTVKVTGHIATKDGSQIATDFNGKIKVKVLDGSVELNIKDILNRNYHFEKAGGTLANGNYEVKNGVFEAEFVLPKDISFSDYDGQIFAYAYTEDDKYAKGNFNHIKVDGIANTNIADHTGPKIDINLDSRKFNAGDVVRNEPLLIVDLSDESGINSTGTGVGHNIEAWIDNSEESINLTSDYESSFEDYKKGSAIKLLLGLKPGIHYVKVRAWDIYNNYSIAETYFNIKDPKAVVVDEVYASPTPFVDNTKITFKHNLDPPVDVELDIYDAKGSKVRTISQKILTPYEATIDWDGNDNYGSPVSIGTYYFRLKLDNLITNDTFLKGRTIKIR